MDVEVDQCDQGVHKGLSYLVLVSDPRKISEVMGVKHSFHIAYPTHIGIGFPGI